LTQPNIHRLFIIGGSSLYQEGIGTEGRLVDRILLTRIESPSFEECDTFMPDFLKDENGGWKLASDDELDEWVGFSVPRGLQEEKGVQYRFQMWARS
jgi:dihydrofolate reductase